MSGNGQKKTTAFPFFIHALANLAMALKQQAPIQAGVYPKPLEAILNALQLKALASSAEGAQGVNSMMADLAVEDCWENGRFSLYYWCICYGHTLADKQFKKLPDAIQTFCNTIRAHYSESKQLTDMPLTSDKKIKPGWRLLDIMLAEQFSRKPFLAAATYDQLGLPDVVHQKTWFSKGPTMDYDQARRLLVSLKETNRSVWQANFLTSCLLQVFNEMIPTKPKKNPTEKWQKTLFAELIALKPCLMNLGATEASVLTLRRLIVALLSLKRAQTESRSELSQVANKLFDGEGDFYRLLSELRKHLPNLPADCQLPKDTLSALCGSYFDYSATDWFPTKAKVVKPDQKKKRAAKKDKSSAKVINPEQKESAAKKDKSPKLKSYDELWAFTLLLMQDYSVQGEAAGCDHDLVRTQFVKVLKSARYTDVQYLMHSALAPWVSQFLQGKLVGVLGRQQLNGLSAAQGLVPLAFDDEMVATQSSEHPDQSLIADLVLPDAARQAPGEQAWLEESVRYFDQVAALAEETLMTLTREYGEGTIDHYPCLNWVLQSAILLKHDKLRELPYEKFCAVLLIVFSRGLIIDVHRDRKQLLSQPRIDKGNFHSATKLDAFFRILAHSDAPNSALSAFRDLFDPRADNSFKVHTAQGPLVFHLVVPEGGLEHYGSAASSHLCIRDFPTAPVKSAEATLLYWQHVLRMVGALAPPIAANMICDALFRQSLKKGADTQKTPPALQGQSIRAMAAVLEGQAELMSALQHIVERLPATDVNRELIVLALSDIDSFFKCIDRIDDTNFRPWVHEILMAYLSESQFSPALAEGLDPAKQMKRFQTLLKIFKSRNAQGLSQFLAILPDTQLLDEAQLHALLDCLPNESSFETVFGAYLPDAINANQLALMQMLAQDCERVAKLSLLDQLRMIDVLYRHQCGDACQHIIASLSAKPVPSERTADDRTDRAHSLQLLLQLCRDKILPAPVQNQAYLRVMKLFVGGKSRDEKTEAMLLASKDDLYAMCALWYQSNPVSAGTENDPYFAIQSLLKILLPTVTPKQLYVERVARILLLALPTPDFYQVINRLMSVVNAGQIAQFCAARFDMMQTTRLSEHFDNTHHAADDVLARLSKLRQTPAQSLLPAIDVTAETGQPVAILLRHLASPTQRRRGASLTASRGGAAETTPTEGGRTPQSTSWV